jgi:hypothetical protein
LNQSSFIDHAVIIWEEREGGFKSLATPERNEQGFLDTNLANSAAGAGKASERFKCFYAYH